MKVLIAKWVEEHTGGDYTMFITPNSKPITCFETIDQLGDPFQTQYKLFDIEDCFDEGIEGQEQIKELYEEDAQKAKDFSKIEFTSKRT